MYVLVSLLYADVILDFSLQSCRFCPGESCYGEMLLLVAMHLQDKKLNQIGKLIQSVLGMKITVCNSYYIMYM